MIVCFKLCGNFYYIIAGGRGLGGGGGGANLSFFRVTTVSSMLYTHYHNCNLIWRTVSHQVDEVIPSDHPRHVASRVIQWYGLIHET